MKELREQIASKNLKNMYLFYGEEVYLKDYYTNAVKKCVCDTDGEDFNVLVMNQKFDLNSFEMFLSSPPVFNDKKVCILKNTDILKSVSELEKERIITAINEMCEGVILVFNESNIEKRGSLYKLIVKLGKVIEFKYQKEIDLKNWVKRFLDKEKITMSDSDISYFLSAAGNGMNDVLTEMTKLVNYKRAEGVITQKDVDVLTCKSLENRVFELINNVQSKNMSKAYEILDELKTLKTEPVMLVTLIFNEFSKIRKLKLLLNTKSSAEALSQVGIRFYGNEYIRKSKMMSLSGIDRVIDACRQTDFVIKSGETEKWLALKMLISQAHI